MAVLEGLEQRRDVESLLSRISTAPTDNPGKLIVVYGPPGVGKTSLTCQAPNTLLIECKDYSSDALKHTGSVKEDLPVLKTSGYYDALDAIKELAKQKGAGYRNIVIDGASGLQDWLDDIVLKDSFDNNPTSYTEFGKGNSVAGIRWREMSDAIIDLYKSGVWVFMLCHKATITEKNSQGSDYYKTVPALHKDKLAPFSKYVDAILYIDAVIGESSVEKLTKKAKVVGGDQRVMYCTMQASYEAKNRMGLPYMIELGDSPQEAYQNFKKAVVAGKKKNDTSKA